MKRKSKVKQAQLRAGAVERKSSPLKRARASIPGASTPRGAAHRSKVAQRGLKRPKSSREKVKAYRARMRRRGMKLIQIWVPDPSSPHFFEEARRQSRLIAESPREKEDQAFIDSLSEWKPD